MDTHSLYGAAFVWGSGRRWQTKQCHHSHPAVAVVTLSPGFLLGQLLSPDPFLDSS